MKKKFLRGIAAALAVVMMMPTTALADYAPPASGDDFVNIKSGDVLYDGGSDTELQLELTETVDPSKVSWNVVGNSSNYVTVDQNGLVRSKGLVGAEGAATTTVQVRAVYDDGTNSAQTIQDITLNKRTIVSDSFDVDTTYDIQKTYTVGESFNTDGIKVTVKYNDSDSTVVLNAGDYTIEPATFTTAEETDVKIKYTYNGTTVQETMRVNVEAEVADTVKSVEIVTPGSGEVEKNHVINEVKIFVTWNSGKTELVTATTSNKNGVTIGGYTLGSKITEATSITAKYGNVTSDPITITVKEAPPVAVTASVTKQPTKVKYVAGEKFIPAGMEITFYYGDTSNPYVKRYTGTSTIGDELTEGTTQITLTNVADDKGNKATVVVTGLTVTKSYKATEIDKDTNDYELWDAKDIEIKVGDVLNTDIKWYDIFKEVRVRINDEWRTIDHKNDLENYPGVELLLKVYNKDSEEIKASYVDSDGNVRIQLCFRNGSGSVVTDTSVTIREYIPVSEAGCTATAYRSKTSSSVTGTPITESELDDILDILEERSDAISALGVSNSYKENFAVTIKLGKDQDLGSYSFEPDHDHVITIDLNGHDLELDSDWIEYNNDNEDLVVIITNTSSSSGTLKYGDKNVTLTVANGSKLEFTEGNIPMDTDAECTVTIYKNGNSTSSSALLKTKVFETLKDALKSLEDQNDAVDEYEIDNDYEDTFVVKMKLGEDQDLDDYTFAPDYDTTISIDLNGCEVELESEWIDYDNCDDLVVKFNNTNSKTKGKLKYSDISNTAVIEVASGDSALTFEKDKIPGIYKVEIASAANGTVKASPNKETALKGSTVTFTITPDTGYEIDTVKNDTKTIAKSSSGYTVDSKGVGTYKVTVSADVSLKVTFKKAAASSSSSSTSSSSSAANWNNPFTDVSKNAQYYDAVAYVCSEGLFNGMTATKFEPTTTMTRAMFVTVLGRLAGVDVSKYSGTSFTDVSKTDQQISWAAPYIEWAVKVGLTNGTGNGKFSPNDPITHQQMYLFMYRYAMSIEQITTPLSGIKLSNIGILDAGEVADWAEDGVKFASKYGILITSGSKLTPTENALRCELAMLLHGFCVKVLER